MRAVRPYAAKFPIVIAVVAVRAEDLRAHAAALHDAVEIQRVGQKAGLWQSAAANINGRVGNLSCARAVAAQAIFVLIHGRIHGGHAIRRVDARYACSLAPRRRRAAPAAL